MLLRAKHVVPVDGPSIKNGAVRIDRGRIAEIGPARRVHGEPRVDFADAVIFPGLVNAHTHLELTHLAGKVPPGPNFIDWLERLLTSMREIGNPAGWFSDSAREGMRQSLAVGVTTVGDISSRPVDVRPVLSHGPLRSVSFGEVTAMGTRRARLSERLQAATDSSSASERLTIGISPHSPYSIEPDGIRACVEAATRLDLRVCMHVAESREEAEFTQQNAGDFRAFLERLGVWDGGLQCPRLSPVSLARACGILGDRTLLAHCNYVSEDDITLLAVSGTHVAYCPRTHAAFGHDPHRFGDMLTAGVNVCIGTDSLASNPSLSVLDEIRFLRKQFEQCNGDSLLSMATIRGARALGVASQTGSLTVGKWADLAVVPLETNGPADPVENVLRSTMPPVATFARGVRIGKSAR